MLLLTGAMAVGASIEIAQMHSKRCVSVSICSALIAILILGIAAADVSSTLPWMVIYGIILLFFVSSVWMNVSREQLEAYALLGIFLTYISFGCAAMFLARENLGLQAAPYIFLVLVATWSHDIGAYVAGKSFGRRPFFKSISPKKTWEGFWGGALACIFMPMLTTAAFTGLGSAFFTAVDNGALLTLVLPCVILVPLADLIESKWKRYYNIKDSGNIIPGHGGVLDRIDVLLVTMPWVLLYLS